MFGMLMWYFAGIHGIFCGNTWYILHSSVAFAKYLKKKPIIEHCIFYFSVKRLNPMSFWYFQKSPVRSPYEKIVTIYIYTTTTATTATTTILATATTNHRHYSHQHYYDYAYYDDYY